MTDVLVKVLAAMPEGSDDLPGMVSFDAVLRKPHRFTEAATMEWLELIHSLGGNSSAHSCGWSHV